MCHCCNDWQSVYFPQETGICFLHVACVYVLLYDHKYKFFQSSGCLFVRPWRFTFNSTWLMMLTDNEHCTESHSVDLRSWMAHFNFYYFVPGLKITGPFEGRTYLLLLHKCTLCWRCTRISSLAWCEVKKSLHVSAATSLRSGLGCLQHATHFYPSYPERKAV
jgi:hypothetical protein